MFFWKKQSKRKMNLSRKIMAFVLAGVLLLSSVGMNVSAQEIVTKKSTISKNTKVDIYKATVQSGNGERTYRVFAQTSKKYKKNSFISLHGCAVCSLTTVLSGYSKKYRNYTPDKTAVRQIEKHLKTGNPVIIEVNNRTQKNGRFGSYTNKWSSSKHTMVLLGMTNTGKVIVADSATRKWSGKKQRIKFTTMKELVKYMIPCKSVSTSVYYKSVSSAGGYILVNP